MKNASTLFKNELNNDNRKYIKTARITLTDGTKILLNNSDLWGNGIKISGSSSGNSSFDIGSVIIGQNVLVLNNIEDKFSDYDFTNATIDNVKVGLALPDGTEEYIAYGIFTVSDANYNGSIITLTAYDNIYKFDRPYSESTLEYPATLNEIVRDACSKCGVTLYSVEFPNDDFVVNERPADSAITFRNVLQWAAQISGSFCVADEQGRLVFKWYDVALLDSLIHLDGGRFEPWEKDNIVDGGSFNPWDKKNVIDGGSFSSLNEIHHIYSWNRLSVSTDDVVITGIKIVDEIETESGRESISALSGSEGYVLEISGNKLVQGNVTSVSNYLGSKIIGMRFRPFSGSSLSNPLIEPGDIAVISGKKENSYNTIITANTFQPGNFQQISCNAMSSARNSAQRYSKATQAYVDARREINKEKSERQQAIDNLNTKLENSPGLYTTTETAAGGGKIYYLHDKPKLSDSMIVWKMTAEAWGVSTDGGKTYNAGMTVDGDTIVRILSAVGVNADWIKTGTMSADRIRGGAVLLGGANNTNGILIIRNASGTEIGRWDNGGISATQGTFTGTVHATSGSFSGEVNAGSGTIGEWQIIGGNLTNGLPYTGAGDSNATGMGSYGGGWAFWAGNGRYAVSQAGALHAENADIAGNVNASSGTFNGTVNAVSGVFDNVTVRNSNVTNSSLSGSAGTISGGTYSSPYISGGTLGSPGGAYVGSCNGSTLGSCTLGGTSLATGNGGGYFASGESGSARMYGPSTAQVDSGGNTYIGGGAILLQRGPVTIYSSLDVRGAKDRSIQTQNYGIRKLSSYETPLPTFADYGTGVIGEDGTCFITSDPVFLETVAPGWTPVVFLTKYGNGELYVDEKNIEKDSVLIKGTPGMKFSWEMRYKQLNTHERLIEDGVGNKNCAESDFSGDFLIYNEHNSMDYEESANQYFSIYSRTCIDYGIQGTEYFESFERGIMQ